MPPGEHEKNAEYIRPEKYPGRERRPVIYGRKGNEGQEPKEKLRTTGKKSK